MSEGTLCFTATNLLAKGWCLWGRSYSEESLCVCATFVLACEGWLSVRHVASDLALSCSRATRSGV
jgi:hypothetical protein